MPGPFPLHQKRPWERAWDGGSSISRGRAHIHIFVFTHRKNNRFQKKSTLQNTNVFKMTPLPHVIVPDCCVTVGCAYYKTFVTCFNSWFPYVLPTISKGLLEVSESEKYPHLGKNITYKWSMAMALGMHDRLSYMMENYKESKITFIFSGIIREDVNK